MQLDPLGAFPKILKSNLKSAFAIMLGESLLITEEVPDFPALLTASREHPLAIR